MIDDQNSEGFTVRESASLQALTAVQEQLTEERERRREERFVWIVVTLSLLDLILLGGVTNVATPIVIMILQLVALGIAVRRMGVKNAVAIVDRVTSAIVKKEID